MNPTYQKPDKHSPFAQIGLRKCLEHLNPPEVLQQAVSISLAWSQALQLNRSTIAQLSPMLLRNRTIDLDGSQSEAGRIFFAGPWVGLEGG